MKGIYLRSFHLPSAAAATATADSLPGSYMPSTAKPLAEAASTSSSNIDINMFYSISP